MKNILIPTDFSENAWNATEYALTLFEQEQCVFHLLNTYTPSIVHSRFMASTATMGVGEAISINSVKGLEKIVARIKKKYASPLHRFETISSFSILTDKVKELVEEKDIDLIITGTKGASGVEEVFMGSNTVRIIKSVQDCPVLAVPKNFEFETPSEIAFATDFNRFYTISELEPLITLAKLFKAAIRIVHVQHNLTTLTELQQFNLNMLRKYLKEVEHYVHKVSELNSISKTLEVFTAQLDIHLLAMLHYQHSYLDRITREPVVKRIAFHTHIPLLIIPEIGMNGKANGKRVLAYSK